MHTPGPVDERETDHLVRERVRERAALRAGREEPRDGLLAHAAEHRQRQPGAVERVAQRGCLDRAPGGVAGIATEPSASPTST